MSRNIIDEIQTKSGLPDGGSDFLRKRKVFVKKGLTKRCECSKIIRLTAGQAVGGLKNFLKKFRKPLDKGSAVWYNNRVAPREDLR